MAYTRLSTPERDLLEDWRLTRALKNVPEVCFVAMPLKKMNARSVSGCSWSKAHREASFIFSGSRGLSHQPAWHIKFPPRSVARLPAAASVQGKGARVLWRWQSCYFVKEKCRELTGERKSKLGIKKDGKRTETLPWKESLCDLTDFRASIQKCLMIELPLNNQVFTQKLATTSACT